MNDVVAVVSAAMERLPALVQRAAAALAQAETAAEVLEAGVKADIAYDQAKRLARMAAAKNAHDELIAAARRAQGDAAIIMNLARERLANEYDAAQERGEVAGHGGGRNFKVASPDLEPTVADLGLTKQQIHEARQVRDAEKAEPGIVKRTVEEKLANGEEPTKAAVQKAVVEVLKPKKAAKPKKAKTPAEPPPEAKDNVVSIEPRLPYLPSFEHLDKQIEAQRAHDDVMDGPDIDLNSLEGRARAFNGSISTLDLIEITGKEFWRFYHKDPARTVYEGRVRNAYRKLLDIVKEMDRVQLQRTQEPKARHQPKGSKG